MNVGKRVRWRDNARVTLERAATMRKTSYAVTFLLVSVSLTLVSPRFSLNAISITTNTLFKNILAITRTDWYPILFLNLIHPIMPFLPGSSIQDESSSVPGSMSTMAF